jgi:GntR family transcriptional regulator
MQQFLYVNTTAVIARIQYEKKGLTTKFVLLYFTTTPLQHITSTSLSTGRQYAPSRRTLVPGGSFMTIGWNDNTPIYRQLKERVIGMMLDGALKAGDALPSVRQVAAEYQLNPITVSKAYQELVDDNLVEKRRGIGMYVTEGASEKLLASERERFVREEWPAMVERIRRLGLDLEQLLRAAQPGAAS